MIDVLICPICQSTEWRQVFPVSDYSISKEVFSLKECINCTLIITSPRPSDQNLSSYYQSKNYISHSGKADGFINSLYLLARNYSLNWKLTLVNSLLAKGQVLDVGCGTGEFLNVLKNNGWQVEGVEPNPGARKKAEKLTQSIIHQSWDSLNNTFNLITLWHVLEHLPNLDEQFKIISEKISPGGILLIAVPNHNSWDGQKYKQHWAGYDVPRHLWHFNQQSMVLLLQKYQFNLLRVIPMKLDAFYVSMLSEKYKGNSSAILGSIKGFINGLVSNNSAKRTGEYSSLIYIARK